jgi:hypothetical protein
MTIEPSDVGGGSDPAAIVATAHEGQGHLPGLPAGSPAAWPAKVLDVLFKWTIRQDAPPLPIAFVLVPSLVGLSGDVLELFNIPNNRELDPGAVYLCSEGMGRARRQAIATSVNELYDALVGSDHLPTLIHSRVDDLVCWYPNGIADADCRLERSLSGSGSAITTSVILDELDMLHRNRWISPSASPHANLWSNAARRVPVKETEKVLQADVCLWFICGFRDHDIRHEVIGTTGRCDVLLTPKSGNASGRGAIEIKVLREFYHPRDDSREPTAVGKSEHVEALDKGVGQAWSYAKTHSCDAKVLCVCDMRKINDDDIFKAVTAKAKRLGVALGRYFIYPTDDEHRDALVSDELATSN